VTTATLNLLGARYRWSRPPEWKAVVSAKVPGLPGNELHFAVDDEGAILVQDAIDPELLDPLADRLCDDFGPPFVAIAVRDEGDIWAAASSEAEIVKLPYARGETIEVTRMDGAVTVKQDCADADERYPEIEALLDGDETAVAHRFTGDTWVVELFPL
jgi:hypothetical protein